LDRTVLRAAVFLRAVFLLPFLLLVKMVAVIVEHFLALELDAAVLELDAAVLMVAFTFSKYIFTIYLPH
jgi:hypothetical protein